MRFKSIASVAVAAVLAGFASTAAEAGELQISPLTLQARAGSPSNSVTLENRGTAPVRIQVSGFTWSESPSGEMQLAPAPDLVFFPTLLTIASHERRTVKIGFEKLPPAAIERTYRVFFSELPALDEQINPLFKRDAGIKYLTKFGVPIFVEASARPEPVAQIQATGFRAGKYGFVVQNTGNSHYLVTRIVARAHDAGGHVIAEPALKAWYVLAKQERQYEIPLDAAECSRVRDVTVDLQMEGGKGNVSRVLPAPQGCK